MSKHKTEKSIKKYLQWMVDAYLSARLSGVDFAAKEVKYRIYCHIKYQTEAEGKHNQEKRMADEGCIPKTSASIWHLNREIHKKAFEALCSYLQVVIENKRVLMMPDVSNYYCHLLHEFQGNTLEVTLTAEIKRKVEKVLWRENMYCWWKQEERQYIIWQFIFTGGGCSET